MRHFKNKWIESLFQKLKKNGSDPSADNNNVTLDKNNPFKSLGPVTDADISGYEEFLDSLLFDSFTLNIAMTGPYGSGKSSIIESYIEKVKNKPSHKALRFHQIKIASFKSVEKKKGNKEPTETTTTISSEGDLERRIVNNLRYSIDDERLADTNFFRGKKYSPTQGAQLIGYAVATSFLLVLITNLTLAPMLRVILWAALLLFFGIFLYDLGNLLLKNREFTKISIDKISIEMSKELKSNSSYFDKFMVDVVELFEKLDANVIIFEDIDRFNNSDIFEKLREINLMLNSGRSRSESIKFVYLVRDDLFKYDEITKLFDAVIPVIPVMDESNSYDKFLELIKSNDAYNNLEARSHKIYRIINFVGDYRLLQSVLHDFVIYSRRIDQTSLNPENLFALLTYKRMFPKDFALLQKDKGVLHQLVSNKEKIIDTIKERNLISNDSKDYDDSKLEYLRLNELFEMFTSQIFWEFLNTKLKEQFDFDENASYDEIMKSDQKELIPVLLREGFVSEHYREYISYFYPNSLSPSDLKIVRSIISHDDSIEIDKIEKPNEVLRRIEPSDIYRTKLMHKSLAKQVLIDKKEDFILEFINVAKIKNNWNFILELLYELETPYNRQFFIEQIESNWTTILEDIAKSKPIKRTENESLTFGFTVLFSEISFENLAQSIISNAEISTLMSSQTIESIIALSDISREKFINRLKELNLKLNDIASDSAQINLYDRLLKDKLINIDTSSLAVLLSKYSTGIEISEWSSGFITKLMNLKSQQLREYLVSHQLESLLQWMLTQEGSIEESIDTIANLIAKNANSPILHEYIKRVRLLQPISQLNDLPDIYWDDIISNENVEITLNNIYLYFQHKQNLSISLIKQINDTEIIQSEQIQVSSQFSDFVIKNESINNNQVIAILKDHISYEDVSFDINTERLKLLIDAGIVRITTQNVLRYMQHGIDVLWNCANSDSEAFKSTIQDVSQLLGWTNVNHKLINSIKVDTRDNQTNLIILESIQGNISILNPVLTNDLIGWILENNKADSNEVVEFIKSKDISSELFEPLASYIEKMDVNTVVKILDTDFLRYLVNNSHPTHTIQKVFVSNVEQFQTSELEAIFIKLGLSEFASVFSKKQPKVPSNEINIKLSNDLKNRDVLSRVKTIDSKLWLIPRRNIKK